MNDIGFGLEPAGDFYVGYYTTRTVRFAGRCSSCDGIDVCHGWVVSCVHRVLRVAVRLRVVAVVFFLVVFFPPEAAPNRTAPKAPSQNHHAEGQLPVALAAFW